MKGMQMLALNKKCWDTVAPYFFQVDCLPKYNRIPRLKMKFICSIQLEIKRFLILMWKWAFAEIYGRAWGGRVMGS